MNTVTRKQILLLVLITTSFYMTGIVNARKAAESGKGGRMMAVYVVDKGLYYDTFIKAPLAPVGKFQLLDVSTEPPSTPTGPDGFDNLGVKWWVDDGDRLMEDNGDDIYFSGPLLGPGRKNP